MTNFQLLMLSPNLLKSQSSILKGGGGGLVTNFQLLMLSPNWLKSHQSPISGGGGGGGGWQPTFKVNFKLSKNLS